MHRRWFIAAPRTDVDDSEGVSRGRETFDDLLFRQRKEAIQLLRQILNLLSRRRQLLL